MTRLADVFLLHGRALEWATSYMMFAFGFTLIMPGATLEGQTSFIVLVKFIETMGWTEPFFGFIFCFVAAVRGVALFINGRWTPTPKIRRFGAFVGSPLFMVLGVAAGTPYFSGQADGLSTGFGTYLGLSVLDMIAAHRSSADVRAYSVR